MPKYLKLKEVAVYLNVSRLTLFRWIKKGILPARKIGGRWMVDQADLSGRGLKTTGKSIHQPPVTAPLPLKPDYQENRVLKLKAVCEYLCINRKTVERWIKSGQLPAVKLGGHWVVQEKDLETLLKRRVFLLGRNIQRMLFFSPEVLDIYRANPKYYVQESAFHGRLGNKEDQNLMHSARSARIYNWNKEAFGKGAPTELVWFPEMPFWKIKLMDGGGYAIAVDPRVFNHLPRPEQAKWLRYRMLNPRL